MVDETNQGQTALGSTATDRSEPHTLVHRRSFLVGTGAGVVGISSLATSVSAQQSGLNVEFDGSVGEDTELIIRVHDHRGRNQQFSVDESTTLPASTTLERIRTDDEIEFDLLIYGEDTIEIDKLDFTPTAGVYPDDAGSAEPAYTIARNIHSVVYSGLTYVAIVVTLVGTIYHVTERVTPTLTDSSNRGVKLIGAGIVLLFLIFALGALAGLLGWIVG